MPAPVQACAPPGSFLSSGIVFILVVSTPWSRQADLLSREWCTGATRTQSAVRPNSARNAASVQPAGGRGQSAVCCHPGAGFATKLMGYGWNLAIQARDAIISRIISRQKTAAVLDRLDQFPAVALLGPRQAGKTTLAEQIGDGPPSIYLDLEDPADRGKLADPALYLSGHEDKLVILDEIQRMPELFQTLRGLIDKGRRRNMRTGRFLLLGSASMDLLKQSGESLAGRIAYVERGPFNVLEADGDGRETLWTRGGFPDSFLATTDEASTIWRENFIRTYLERDIPQLGPRIPGETLRRFWTMLAMYRGAC